MRWLHRRLLDTLEGPEMTRGRGKSWTPAEDAILLSGRTRTPLVPHKDLAKRLGRSIGCCWYRLSVLLNHKVAVAPAKIQQSRGDYSGVLPCLRCEKEFRSPDRRKIRVCDSCKNTSDWRATDAFSRSAGTATPARLAF